MFRIEFACSRLDGLATGFFRADNCRSRQGFPEIMLSTNSRGGILWPHFARRTLPQSIGCLLVAATSLLLNGGCGVPGRMTTISVERESDGSVTPVLEERQVLALPYEFWHEQREQAENRLAAIEARLEELLADVEGDTDPTETKIEIVTAAFEELRQFAAECGFVVPAIGDQPDAAAVSFSRGDLAARIERRREKLDLLATLTSRYRDIRRTRHELVALQALRSPIETFTTNASGFVTVPTVVFMTDERRGSDDNAKEDPEAAAMRGKWVLATIDTSFGPTTIPNVARAVVDTPPLNKYRLVIRQPDH